MNDIDFNKYDINKLAVCGFLTDKWNDESQSATLIQTSDAFSTSSSAQSLEFGSYSQVYIKSNSDIILLRRGKVTDNPQYSYIVQKDWNNIYVSTILFEFESPSLSAYNHTAMNFTDNSLGYMVVDSKIGSESKKRLYKTTNGGNNWNIDLDNISGITTIDYFGNLASNYIDNLELVNFANLSDRLYIRNIDGVDILAFSDGGTNENVNITVGSTPYSTPAYNNWIRPSCLVNCPENIGNDKVFYKWNDNAMGSSNHVFLLNSERKIVANYKTKLYSDRATAISYPPQTKAIRDAQDKVHQLHSSLGGIFYSRSSDNGNNFSNEEIVSFDPYSSDNSADGNLYPALGEVFNPLTPPPPDYNERNVVATWQRREGNKEVIKFAYRTTISGTDYYWARNSNYFIDVPSSTPFNTKAQVFASLMNPGQVHDYFSLIVYLRPNGGSTELVVQPKFNNSSTILEEVIETGNISDFSVTRYIDGPYHYLHFAYKKDNHIHYEKWKFYILSGPGVGREDMYEYHPVSYGDVVTHRYTPDISLRNGLPVIAYRGFIQISKIIYFEGGGDGILINYNSYPIIVKFKYLDPNPPPPHEVWSGFFNYDSPFNSTQENPNVEGSKDEYAHLLNYSVNNSLFKQFVRIDEYPVSGYHCSPAIFTGSDAKLIRGSYQGLFGANSYPSLLTCSTEVARFKIGIQTFTINNNQVPIGEIDAFSNLAGVVEKNDLDYKFTLGPLFANNQIEFDDGTPPQSVQTVIEFNDEMVSDVFWMSDYDTLILGANGCYQGDQTCPFEIIRYDVNLINYTTSEPHRLLFLDTVNVEDSLEIEFLRGFIIEDIPNGADSFYVELVVNPDDIGGDEDYGMGGDYDGGDGGGDALNWKVKIFFEGEDIPGNTSTPKEYALMQNYPNPFNPVTTINYDLPKNGNVNIVIYDILGREVSRLVNNEFKSAGRYSVVFDGSSLSSGIYFYRIEVNNGKDFMKVKRMVLIK